MTWVIKPDLKRINLLITLGIIGAIVAVLASHFGLVHIIGINLPELVGESLEIIGISIDIDEVKLTFAGALIILLTFGLVNLKYNKEITVYPDRLMTKSRTIPFANITRVIFDKSSLPQNLLGYGTLIIEASETDVPNLQIEFIDKVDTVCTQVQQAVYQFKVAKYQQEQQQARVSNILDQW
ncbi:MAG: hypothetical protein R6V53_02440 [Candidatus Woesearchaeota archaeon]